MSVLMKHVMKTCPAVPFDPQYCVEISDHHSCTSTNLTNYRQDLLELRLQAKKHTISPLLVKKIESAAALRFIINQPQNHIGYILRTFTTLLARRKAPTPQSAEFAP